MGVGYVARRGLVRPADEADSAVLVVAGVRTSGGVDGDGARAS